MVWTLDYYKLVTSRKYSNHYILSIEYLNIISPILRTRIYTSSKLFILFTARNAVFTILFPPPPSPHWGLSSKHDSKY